jgi:hypothetical protein
MAEMAVGKTIRMPCMRRGLVSYPDETILVTQNSLDELAKTAYGIPVVIEHPGIPIDGQSIKDIKVVGRVATFDYEPEADLWWAEFVVDDDEAVQLLKSGYGVSTAWYGNDYKSGGTYNNVPYDRELLTARYEHLAIVKNPRYEMAKDPVFLNSKSSGTRQGKAEPSTILINSVGNPIGGIKMLAKIWRTVKEEVKANENEELVLELEHGQVPLSKVVEELKTMKAKEAAKKEEEAKPAARVLNADDEVEVDGRKMKVHELVSEYHAAKKHSAEGEAKMQEAKDKDEAKEHEAKDEAKEHESEDKKEHEAKDKDEAKEHEAKDKEKAKEHKDEARKDAEAKCNAADETARFNSLKSAYENGKDVEVTTQFVSLRERTDMGRARYGSSK